MNRSCAWWYHPSVDCDFGEGNIVNLCGDKGEGRRLNCPSAQSRFRPTASPVSSGLVALIMTLHVSLRGAPIFRFIITIFTLLPSYIFPCTCPICPFSLNYFHPFSRAAFTFRLTTELIVSARSSMTGP